MYVQRKVDKKAEVLVLEPLSKLHTRGAAIDAKVFNTPNRMAETGWLPQWKLKEAVRELLANMIDQARTVTEKFISNTAVLEFTEEPGRFAVHVGTVLLAEAKWGRKKRKYIKSYHSAGIIKARAEVSDFAMEETQFLELVNYSSTLPYSSFYVGHSSKRENLAVIGKHGEGLTGACVVLNRAGCNIIADCSHNAYQAHIVRLHNNVCFQLKRKKGGSGPQQDTVRFTVVFDPRKPSEDMQDLMNSVRLPSAASSAGITTARGTLLTEPALRGKQFNRSIFVGEDENCLFGYDFLDPDKTLLQGRDRNSHVKNGLVAECGAIISEAILQSEEVRKEVLKCFLFGPAYNPDGAGEMALKRYTDLKDGEGLTAAAVDTLRLQYEQSLLPAGQKVVYCARDSTMLNEIKRMNGMVSAYCHRVLHNHVAIIHDFRTALVRDAVNLDPTTRIGSLRDQLQPLLGVRELKQSIMVLPEAQAGIWVLGPIGYVTSVHALGAANAVGLTEKQEISFIRTLLFAQVPVENQVKIMRLLRNQPEPVPLPEVLPSLSAPEEPAVEEEVIKEDVEQVEAPADGEDAVKTTATIIHEEVPVAETVLPAAKCTDPFPRDTAGTDPAASAVATAVVAITPATAVVTPTPAAVVPPTPAAVAAVAGVAAVVAPTPSAVVAAVAPIPVAAAPAVAPTPATAVAAAVAPTPVVAPTPSASAAPATLKEEGSVALELVPLPARGPVYHEVMALPSCPYQDHPLLTEQNRAVHDDISVIECEADHVDMTQFSDADDVLSFASVDATEIGRSTAQARTGTNVQATADTEAVEETQFSDMESEDEVYVEGHVDDEAEDSDAFDLGTEYSEDSQDRDNDRRSDTLPSPKRRRLNSAGGSSGTSSANTSVEVVDLSSDNLSVVSVASRPPPQLLQDLPLEISLSSARHSTVHQLRFFKPCGVWLYSDNYGAEEEMQELLNVCLPTYKDRYKLRLLSSLLHIVVFVTADKRAPPAFNSGPHSVCINLGACGNEQMFKYILHAQMQAVNLVE